MTEEEKYELDEDYRKRIKRAESLIRLKNNLDYQLVFNDYLFGSELEHLTKSWIQTKNKESRNQLKHLLNVKFMLDNIEENFLALKQEYSDFLKNYL